MSQISAIALRAALNVSRLGGIPVEALLTGLPFDEASLARRRAVAWDDYATVVERMAAAAGPPEMLVELLATSYHLAWPEPVAQSFSRLVAPRQLYRFILVAANPIVFWPVDTIYNELAPDRVRARLTLRAGSRDCEPFFRGSIGSIRGLSCYLGLPPARVEVEELTPRSMTAVAHLPPSRTLFGEAGRFSDKLLRGAARLIQFLGVDSPAEATVLARLGLEAPTSGSGPPPTGPLDEPKEELEELVRQRLDRATNALGLTTRQTEVLGHVVRGLSNKEIAALLGCADNTVEQHVTHLLRKAGLSGRGQLIARFWANTLR